ASAVRRSAERRLRQDVLHGFACHSRKPLTTLEYREPAATVVGPENITRPGGRAGGGGVGDVETQRACTGDDRRGQPVLLASDAGGQTQERDARAVRALRRCGREGRGQLRAAGLAPGIARKCP